MRKKVGGPLLPLGAGGMCLALFFRCLAGPSLLWDFLQGAGGGVLLLGLLLAVIGPKKVKMLKERISGGDKKRNARSM